MIPQDGVIPIDWLSVALGIEVHGQDAVDVGRGGMPEMQGGGGLAGAALEVRHGDLDRPAVRRTLGHQQARTSAAARRARLRRRGGWRRRPGGRGRCSGSPGGSVPPTPTRETAAAPSRAPARRSAAGCAPAFVARRPGANPGRHDRTCVYSTPFAAGSQTTPDWTVAQFSTMIRTAPAIGHVPAGNRNLARVFRALAASEPWGAKCRQGVSQRRPIPLSFTLRSESRQPPTTNPLAR